MQASECAQDRQQRHRFRYRRTRTFARVCCECGVLIVFCAVVVWHVAVWLNGQVNIVDPPYVGEIGRGLPMGGGNISFMPGVVSVFCDSLSQALSCANSFVDAFLSLSLSLSHCWYPLLFLFTSDLGFVRIPHSLPWSPGLAPATFEIRKPIFRLGRTLPQRRMPHNLTGLLMHRSTLSAWSPWVVVCSFWPCPPSLHKPSLVVRTLTLSNGFPVFYTSELKNSCTGATAAAAIPVSNFQHSGAQGVELPAAAPASQEVSAMTLLSYKLPFDSFVNNLPVPLSPPYRLEDRN